MNNPLISIITVVYNGATTLEQTMLSVINQTYKKIEYIIIDGGSTDGTVDIIKKYENKLAYWVSESDKGIYDAMNKGIDKATGEWVNFMNSGDIFHKENIIANLFELNITNCDVIYGDVIALRKEGEIHCKSQDIIKIKKNMPFCHQAAFCRLNILKQYMFDLKYSLCAEYNSFYQMYSNNIRFMKTNYIIAFFDAEYGISSMNTSTLIKEVSEISKRNLILVQIEYFYRNLKRFIKKLLN
jgi:glycosyltransferase involved in cell wall biosynthesis